MTRVLFISPQPFFQWRGSPIRVAFDVQALAELGYAVDLLTLPVGERKDIPGVRVIRAPNIFFAGKIPIGPSLLKLGFDVVLLVMAVGLALKHRYRALHCVEDAGPIGVVVSRLIRAKLVFEKHSDPASYRKRGFRNLLMSCYSRVERFTVRHADAVIGTGAGLVRQVRNMGRAEGVYHIFDIPSSLAVATDDEVARIRKQLIQGENELLVGFVGSFAVYQGVDLMFEAMPRVLRTCPQARFVVIGGTLDEIDARRRSLAAQGADASVTFVGRVPPDELPAYLCAQDILLSPRLAGVNTPLKLLDYFKAGRAIAATNTEANRLILDESNAVLTDVGADAFADGICRLIRDASLRDRLAAEGRNRIAQRYNFAEFKRRLRACYEALSVMP